VTVAELRRRHPVVRVQLGGRRLRLQLLLVAVVNARKLARVTMTTKRLKRRRKLQPRRPLLRRTRGLSRLVAEEKPKSR